MIKYKKKIKKNDFHSFSFNKKLKPNKKGVFVTLSAVLILIIIFSLVVLLDQQSNEINEVNIQYSKHKIISNYINTIEDIYLPSLIATSEKYAIANYSYFIEDTSLNNDKIHLKANLTEIIMTGKINTNDIIPMNLTLPGMINYTFHTTPSPITFNYFEFNITSIKHKDNWTIIINTSTNFSINAETLTWRNYSNITWTNTKNYSTEISIIGFVDINQSNIITSQWKENTTQTCYLDDLNGTPSYPCGTIIGLCPLSGCI
jgi:hypothetical protein